MWFINAVTMVDFLLWKYVKNIVTGRTAVTKDGFKERSNKTSKAAKIWRAQYYIA